MKMEWIWPVREMVGKLVLYILIWAHPIYLGESFLILQKIYTFVP